MATWASFQSAIQLVAGLNLALYALPGLNDAEIVEDESLFDEASPVTRLVARANAVGLFAEAVAFKGAIQDHWQPIFKQYALARGACLIVSALTTIILLWASGDRAEASADPGLAWGVILLGFLPAAWLYCLSRQVDLFRIRADNLRNGMEQKVAQTEIQVDREMKVAERKGYLVQ